MPKSYFNKYDRTMSAFRTWLKGKMSMCNITQRHLASVLNCTQGNVSSKLSGKTQFSYKELLLIFNAVHATDDEVLRFTRTY